MAILLLVAVVLAGVIVADAILENTAQTTVTLAGQDFSGLSMGGWLTLFAALGFVAAYLLIGMLAAARHQRARRKALKSSEREMAERVAELERENVALRERENDTDGIATRDGDTPDRTRVDHPVVPAAERHPEPVPHDHTQAREPAHARTGVFERGDEVPPRDSATDVPAGDATDGRAHRADREEAPRDPSTASTGAGWRERLTRRS